MSFTLQDWLVIPVVLAAAGYLLWHTRQSLSAKRGGCPSCSGCATGRSKTPVVLSIAPLHSTASSGRSAHLDN